MMISSTPHVVIGHDHRGKDEDLSVQVSKEVVGGKEKRWLKVQQIDTYGTCSAPGTALNLKWSPPHRGVVKCNVHADWRSPDMMGGVAWIARDSKGSVLYHARDVFTRSSNRIMAELRCIWWAVHSLRNLRVRNVVISSDCQAAIAALYKPCSWPWYRPWLDGIFITAKPFSSITFELASCHSNTIARDIAESTITDGRFNPYLASGGPAWLHDRLRSEAQQCV